MSNKIIEVKPIFIEEINEYTRDVEPIRQMAMAIKIKSNQDYTSAGEFLKKVKGKIKDLDERRKSITSPLDVAKKAVVELFKKPVETLEQLEISIKREMIDFTDEQERIRAEQERKLQEQLKKEQEALQKKAEKQEAKGNVEKAEEIRQQAEILQQRPVFVTPTIDKISGVSFRDKWYAVVVDEKSIPREYLIPDVEKLNKIAQATKGNMQIAGVQFKCDKIVISGRG